MTLSSEMIHEKVKRVLIEEFELEESDLTQDANLYEDLELDSLDGVDLVVALEKEFDFKISREQDEERIRAIKTINDIYDFINIKRDGS